MLKVENVIHIHIDGQFSLSFIVHQTDVLVWI